VNLVLIAVALLLVAASCFFFVRAATATTKDSTEVILSKQYAAVTKAAREETLAFLTIDYRNMDKLIDKVIAGAAGTFKTQYSGSRANLKTSTREAQAVSSGAVKGVGIGEIDARTALVFVAADSQVTNKSTKGVAQPRYYRLRLTMVRQGTKWLTSDLQFVS
jgi:Mce-associated membrane protein